MPITKALTHSHSTPHLKRASNSATSSLFGREYGMLNTIPDPRAHSPASTSSRNGSTDSAHHPDLSDEVATLSVKLVNAINQSGRLDDTLQSTQHELQQAREHIARLEKQNKEQEEKLQHTVSKAHHAKIELQLRAELAEETKQRILMEKEKKRIEAELESLTTALFEEANTMVAAARKETEASERRNDQLRSQMKDTEVLLVSQQEQLQDLKAVMEKLTEQADSERDQISTAPSTPGPVSTDKMSRMFDQPHLSPYSPADHDIPPDHPLRFSHLVHPVLRTDLNSYKEFHDMLRAAKAANSAPSSRVSSGNYSSLNVLGLGSYVNSPTGTVMSNHSNGSTTSLNAPSGSTSPRPGTTAAPLKDIPFYKRALAEDIDPTLRLDQAPGISWMARRTVVNSMNAGSLVIEPHPPIQKHRGPVYACALCGENRVAEQYTRRYRFRTSESDDVQRYPLCDYCLSRMRATCDYIGFLRMVRDGHWRAETEDDVKNAWEESVRLRERMFWTRIGGGVVPAFVQTRDSPKLSDDEYREKHRGSEDGAPSSTAREGAKEDLFKPKANDGKRVSIGTTIISPIEPSSAPVSAIGDVSPLTPDSQDSEAQQQLASQQLHDEAAGVTSADPSATEEDPDPSPQPSAFATPSEKNEKDAGLTVAVPGAFE